MFSYLAGAFFPFGVSVIEKGRARFTLEAVRTMPYLGRHEFALSPINMLALVAAIQHPPHIGYSGPILVLNESKAIRTSLYDRS